MSTTPFLPFTKPSIDEETIAAVADVLRSGWITSGPKVQAFEKALSDYCAGRPVRAFSSGTATLEVALRLANVGPGDEVITTPLSWVATANVILAVGAKPVFVDIDRTTRNIDLDKIEAAITSQTRAIIPVDLSGLPVDRTRLYQIANRHKLRVVEDAAQSFGASWSGENIGVGGDFVSFSFHANKNMTTGEGGALVLPKDAAPDLIARCERLRLQGVQRFADGTMDVDLLGGKANLTDIAAAIGLGQLKHLEAFTARRRALVQRYFERFDKSLGCEMPLGDVDNSNWHMFQVLLPTGTDRGAFIKRMKDEHNIGVGVHYPAMHLFTLYRGLGYKEGDFPVAERVGRETVTLPLFPAMADTDIDRVCQAVSHCLKS